MDSFQKSLVLNNKITVKGNDGFFNLDFDQQAIEEFQRYVDENFGTQLKGIDKIRWLVKNNFYESELLTRYEDYEVEEVINSVYSHNFKFPSYMSIKKFYDGYALRTDDKKKFLETYEDRIIACSLYLAQGNFEFAKKLSKLLIEQKYQPSTPTFSNAGKKRSGKLVSCFLLDMDDSINSIGAVLSNSMKLSKIGGGVAINLSRLRARGGRIKNIASVSSGVVPVMKILEDVFDYADQLGQRRGAGAVYLSIFHMDIVDFLDSKKINADEKSRIQTLSIGLVVPDKFFRLCKEGGTYCVFEPHTIFRKYGQYMTDLNMDQWYDRLVADPEIEKKEISSRWMLNMIARIQLESGYPYITFIDTANRKNPLKKLGKIQITNLCTEIFQIQDVSVIPDVETEMYELKRDVSCNLGSLNINNIFEGDKDLGGIIETAMRALTIVSNISFIHDVPSIYKANKELRSVGLGAMNLNGFLAKNKIFYDDPLALEFVDVLFAAINFYSLQASSKIAKETNKRFSGFENSEYMGDDYWKMYLENDFLPVSERMKEIFKGMKLPTREDWANLKNFVQEYGLYNAYRMAIAPTQTISYVQNATSSVGPIVDIIESRLYGNSLTYYPMPFLSKETLFYYKSAFHMDQKKIIDLVATIQKHVDQGISTALYVTNQTSTRDVVKLYLYAWKKGLKSLYYVRTKNLEVHECLSCSV